MTRLAASIVCGLLMLPLAAQAQVPAPVEEVVPTVPSPDSAPVPSPILSAMPHPFPDIDIHIDPMLFDPLLIEQEIHRELQGVHTSIDTAALEAQLDASRIAVLAQSLTLPASRLESRGGGYNGGLQSLQRRDYDRAITHFDEVIAGKGNRADAALYWKAFAQSRLGQTTSALATLDTLRRDHPATRYLNDARVLEADLKGQSGQPVDPSGIDDDEIKLLAIQGLRRSEQVVPLLEQVLGAANSLNVKRRALYVLALNEDTRARQVLTDYARGAGNPDLQVEAIRYLASRRDVGAHGSLLRDIYTSTSDLTVKREVVNAYVATARAGTRTRGLRSGETPSTPQAATATAAAEELTTLYRQENDVEMKRHLISALFAVGSVSDVLPLIRSEQDPQLRVRAITALGGRRSPEATQALVKLYGELPDADAREAVVSVLTGQRDAGSLIALARQETDPRLKTTLVRHISGLADQSEAAAAYLAEVLR